MSEIRCPYCNSTQISASPKGFSAGKAATGALLFGGIGLLAGAIGKNKVIITCLNCGKSWEAGSHKSEPEPTSKPLSEEDAELWKEEWEAKIELSRLQLEEARKNSKLKAENDELQYIEKQKIEREKCLKENDLLAATVCAFIEISAKLYRAHKEYDFDKDALTSSFTDIVGKDLIDETLRILELDQTSSCYEVLKDSAIESAVSAKQFYDVTIKMCNAINEFLHPVRESAHSKILHFKCMKCGQKYDGDQSNVGQIIECSSCGEKIELIPYDFLNKQ